MPCRADERQVLIIGHEVARDEETAGPFRPARNFAFVPTPLPGHAVPVCGLVEAIRTLALGPVRAANKPAGRHRERFGDGARLRGRSRTCRRGCGQKSGKIWQISASEMHKSDATVTLLYRANKIRSARRQGKRPIAESA